MDNLREAEEEAEVEVEVEVVLEAEAEVGEEVTTTMAENMSTTRLTERSNTGLIDQMGRSSITEATDTEDNLTGSTKLAGREKTERERMAMVSETGEMK